MGDSKAWCSRRTFIVTGVVAVVATIALVCGLLLRDDDGDIDGYRFSKAAVAADNGLCSKTGSNILKDGGSAVDAAIASLLCLSVVHSHSSGVGGGFFMLYYNQESREAVVIDAREAAPAAATERMFVDQPELSLAGGLSVAVPGEFKGYWEAHQRYGVLPWKQLFEPAYNIAVDGFVISKSLENSIVAQEKYIREDPGLSTLFLKSDGSLKLEGDVVQDLKLAKTLLEISNEGVESFYSGDMAANIATEIQEQGGIITAADLENYQIQIKDPLRIQITDVENNQFEILAAPPPSSGVVGQMIVNIMDGIIL